MNLVFDLGGVLVRWEPDAILQQAFDDPALRAAVRTGLLQHADWHALDRGTLSRPEAIARAARRCALPAARIEHFFACIPPMLQPIEGTATLLAPLRRAGHALYCLSNMHHAFIEHLERSCTFWDHFDGRIISCRVGAAKPDPGIYALLLSRFGLDAARTVFIDDMPVNLAAAQAFGISTIRFEDPAQCAQSLAALGLLPAP